MEREHRILESKGHDYTLGAGEENEKDALANFKQVGELVQHNCSACGNVEPVGPRTVWAVLFMKHVLSLLTHAALPHKMASEPISERVLDVRTYGGLYECIDKEGSSFSLEETGEPVAASVVKGPSVEL